MSKKNRPDHQNHNPGSDQVENQGVAQEETKMSDEAQTQEAPVAQAKDPEVIKAQKKAAADKMKARKTAALNILINLAQRMGTEEEKKAAVYLEPGRHIGGSGAGPKAPKISKDLVTEIFGEASVVHEDDIFLQHKMGRPDMRKVIQQGVNRGTWITFDPTTGNYTVVARDTPEAPEGWLGVLPKQPKAL